MSDFDAMVAASALPAVMGAFGRAATYTPTGGDPADVTICVHPAAEGVDEGLLSAECVVIVSLSDVAAPAQGDKLTIGGVDWNVDDIEEKAGSWASLRIRRFATVERSVEGYRHDRRSI